MGLITKCMRRPNLRLLAGVATVLWEMLTSNPALLAQERPIGVKCEVASIKPATARGPQRPAMEFLPGGRFRGVNVPFFQVVATAYSVPWQSIEVFQARIKGIPDWMFRETYDIDAKAENSAASSMTAKARNERIRLMLQSMLADRLKFKARSETQRVSGYLLGTEKSGLKLTKAKITETECTESAPFGPISATAQGCHHLQGGTGRGIHGTAIDLSDLALFLSNWSDRPIVDGTGLKDLFAIDTEGWSPSGNEPSRLSLEDVLRRIGLRLASTEIPIRTIIVEHVEKPSAN